MKIENGLSGMVNKRITIHGTYLMLTNRSVGLF